MKFLGACLSLLALSEAVSLHGEPTQIRGWNSWNSFLQWVSADDLLAQAEIMDSSGMRALNWTYVVADGGWYYDPICGNSYLCEKIDAAGRLVPDTKRYPKGWKGLCDELHAKGFKCGFHLFRGVPGLAWEQATPILGSKENYTVRDAGFNKSEVGPHGAFYEINIAHPAAQQYLDSMFELYCSWGIDFIKLDGMESPGAAEFGRGRLNKINGGIPVAKAYRSAIEKSCGGRNVVLSLSAGGAGIPGWMNTSKFDFVTDEFVHGVKDVIQMTRVTPDTWDIWDDQPDQTSCPLASIWKERLGKHGHAGDPKFENVTGHSGCCWGGRISRHFVEFANYAHIADKFGVFPDGDMLQIGRVGSYENLKPETLAKYSSPPFSPNNCTIAQLQGSKGHKYLSYDPGLCPRQSFLTNEEQKTLVSLWSIARSPLIMGGDLTKSPKRVVELLSNRAVMTMNSHSRKAGEVYRNESSGQCVWASTPTTPSVSPGESRYVGLFNLGSSKQEVAVSYSQLGLSKGTVCHSVIDMWKGQEVRTRNVDGEGNENGVHTDVPKHGAVLLHLSGCSTRVLI